MNWEEIQKKNEREMIENIARNKFINPTDEQIEEIGRMVAETRKAVEDDFNFENEVNKRVGKMKADEAEDMVENIVAEHKANEERMKNNIINRGISF